MNHAWLLDNKLARYSLNTTCQICLYHLELRIRIHFFKPTWPCLIIEVLATSAKFPESSGYCTEINDAFTSCTTNVFGCISGVMFLFKCITCEFPNLNMFHVPLCSFQITHLVMQCIMCQRTKHQGTNEKSIDWTSLVTWYTCHK